MIGSRRTKLLAIGGSLAVVAVAAAACTGGDVSQGDLDAVQEELTASQAKVESLEAREPGTIVQIGDLQPAAAEAVVSDWDTEASLRAGVKLLSTFDSGGDQAWDPAEHPTVFVTSEGEGYAGYISEDYKLAGTQIIDAVTKEIVASAAFDLGFDKTAEPHGQAVSPDGRWIYIPTGDGDAPWRVGPDGGRLLVVDAQTLKLSMVIGTARGPHHIKAFTDWEGNDRVIVETQGGDAFLLDPNNEHRVTFAVGPRELYGQSYQVDADPAGENLYIGLVLGGRGTASELQGAVAKVSLKSGRATYITDVGMYPNGFAFTSDGAFTFVSDSSGDRVYKIDNATNKVVANTQAAVPGPYDIELNSDETELWVVGKGEMTFNRGGTLGLINTSTFTAVNQFDIGGQAIDHNIVNPANPDEMWVTSSGSGETIVWDMAKREVTARIPTANGGDTHSGAFVKYNPDFSGEMLADNSGPRASFLEQQKAAVGQVAAAR